MRRYAQYMRNQVEELLTNYGKIDILWFDFSYPDTRLEGKDWMKGKGKDDWEAEQLIALARRLQPGIIIDNRTGLEQDLWTPEQYQPQEWIRHPETGERVVWEAARPSPAPGAIIGTKPPGNPPRPCCCCSSAPCPSAAIC